MSESNPNQLALAEELSAYLDGELGPEHARRIEERLAKDAHCRRELQRLQTAWDLLDRLPEATVDESFTRTTIEMVALSAEQDWTTRQAQAPRRGRWRLAIAASLALVAGLVGLGVGALVWPNPNRQLLEDLPLVENLDLYESAHSLDYARRLDRSGLFAQEESSDGK